MMGFRDNQIEFLFFQEGDGGLQGNGGFDEPPRSNDDVDNFPIAIYMYDFDRFFHGPPPGGPWEEKRLPGDWI
jgi:hypothetical protein